MTARWRFSRPSLKASGIFLACLGLLVGSGYAGLSRSLAHHAASRHLAPVARQAAAKPLATQTKQAQQVSAPTCLTSQLKLSTQLSPIEGAGTGAALYVFTNISTSSCMLDGYPTLIDTGAYQLHSAAAADWNLSGTPQPVVLAPGGQASFYALVGGGCNTLNPDFGKGAPNPDQPDTFDITPPGSTTALRLTGPTPSACEDQTFGMSYVYPGVVFFSEMPQ